MAPAQAHHEVAGRVDLKARELHRHHVTCVWGWSVSRWPTAAQSSRVPRSTSVFAITRRMSGLRSSYSAPSSAWWVIYDAMSQPEAVTHSTLIISGIQGWRIIEKPQGI